MSAHVGNKKIEPSTKSMKPERVPLDDVIGMIDDLNSKIPIGIVVDVDGAQVSINYASKKNLLEKLRTITPENLRVEPSYRVELHTPQKYVTHYINVVMENPVALSLNGVSVKECSGIQIVYKTSMASWMKPKR